VGIDYSTTWDGEVKGGYRVIGAARARAIGAGIARSITASARASDCPVAWVTGNSYLPPLRSFTDADRVWHADNGVHSADEFAGPAVWEELASTVHRLLDEAGVYLGSPDYDNALYAVDLRRWRYASDEEGMSDDLNDDYERIEGT
jgi:hypothetical protein